LAEANTCSQGSNALANPSVNIIASHGLDDVLSLRYGYVAYGYVASSMIIALILSFFN